MTRYVDGMNSHGRLVMKIERLRRQEAELVESLRSEPAKVTRSFEETKLDVGQRLTIVRGYIRMAEAALARLDEDQLYETARALGLEPSDFIEVARPGDDGELET